MATDNTTIPTSAPDYGQSGDTAWILTSAALVFLMTPGLAFFYGGLANQKVVLNTIMMSFSSAAVITIHWAIIGFSLSFAGSNSFIGGGHFMGLSHIAKEVDGTYITTAPLAAYWFFQLTFAIITPALISGAVVGRMRFRSWIVFVLLWATLVYDPVAHWVWSAWPAGVDEDGNPVTKYGWLRALGVLDYAGGTVVHIISGFSGLVACIFLGPRTELADDTEVETSTRKEMKEAATKPHNVPFVVLGVGLLWFGWNGFNGGSALVASDGNAALAVINTNISAAMALCVWMALDAFFLRKINVSGAMCGVVAGLVGITPGCGFVHPRSSLFIGAFTAFVVYFALKLKEKLKYDDALDAFGGHGVGGFVGSILVGMFAQKEMNPYGADGLFWGGGKLFGYQILASVITALYACVMTALIMVVLKYTIGIRPSQESEKLGLDMSAHGGAAYVDTSNSKSEVEAKQAIKSKPQASEEARESSSGVV